MKINYIEIDVYRAPRGDCSNFCISARFARLKLYCPDGPWSFDSETETPLNLCTVKHTDYSFGHSACIVPACVDDCGNVKARPGWYMFGGNIGYTSDSRFTEQARTYNPLKIHDRRE